MKPAPHGLITVFAVAMVSAIGGLVFNTMPILLSAAGAAFSLSPSQLGTLSLTAGLGYLAGTLTGPFWVDRVKWRPAAFAIVLCAALSFLICAYLSGIALFGGFAAFGFFCALAIALAMRVLADMPDPERAYGARLSVELISIGVFLMVLPVVFVARAGFPGAVFGLAAFTLFLGLGAFLFPKRTQNEQTQNDPNLKPSGFPSWEQAKPSYILLGIFTLYLIANVGMFFFLAVIAERFSPSPEQFSLMFGGLKWLGGVAGAIGAIIGARAGLRISHVSALALLFAGLAGLYFADDFTVFMIASWVWEFGFTLGCLYQTAAIARFDISNKLVVLVPTAFALSMIVGGKLAGELLSSGSPNGLYVLVAVCAVLPAAYILAARPDPELYAAPTLTGGNNYNTF